MNLLDVVARTLPPEPFAEGEKIPWHAPAFSRRMLAEHLSQDHDLASRRTGRIEAQVRWIHGKLGARKSARILDVGCGPGLYTSRLARFGHKCTGVDLSPASIEHARTHAAEHGLDCGYVLGDARKVGLGEGYDLTMFLFGEINVFRRADALSLLGRVCDALAPGGTLLLEPHTAEVVERAGRAAPRFSTHASGLFADAPYLQLEESFWDPATATATTRWWIVDAESATVTRHAQTVQAYDDEGYRALLGDAGFEDVVIHASWAGLDAGDANGLFAITARRPA